jgi:L-ascorbate metabolism protein UlaG (beta-lactamase superfamily)
MTAERTAESAARRALESESGERRERILASPRFHDGRFRNTAPVGPRIKGNPFLVLGEYFFGREGRTPPAALPMDRPLATWATRPETGLRATWLGHSSVLLEIGGYRVLTDPVFAERASPLSFAGPRRFHPVPVSVSELPPLDAVLVSHDHYDHLCKETVGELAKLGVPFVTSLGVGSRLEAFGVLRERITELDWWEEHVVAGGTLSFTAAPAQHFSGRGLGDGNATLWSSWRLKSDDHSVFFSGDTGLTEEFREIGQRLGPFDLSMFEVGAYHPSWGAIHLGPANALRAHALLGSGLFMPVHWGTFNLALHAWDEPVETLVMEAAKAGTPVLTPRLGQAIEPARVEGATPWWRHVVAGAHRTA